MQCKCKSHSLHCALIYSFFTHLHSIEKNHDESKSNSILQWMCHDTQMCDGVTHHYALSIIIAAWHEHTQCCRWRCAPEGGRREADAGSILEPWHHLAEQWTHVEAHTLFIHSEYLAGDLWIICTSHKHNTQRYWSSKSERMNIAKSQRTRELNSLAEHLPPPPPNTAFR